MSAAVARDSARFRMITAIDCRRLESELVAAFAKRLGSSIELSDTLSRAIVVPPELVPQDVVTMNSIVLLATRAGGDVERKLVYPWDADDGAGYVSVLSPLGLALLGNRVGARLPPGLGRGLAAPWAIAQLLYQPEEAGDRHR